MKVLLISVFGMNGMNKGIICFFTWNSVASITLIALGNLPMAKNNFLLNNSPGIAIIRLKIHAANNTREGINQAGSLKYATADNTGKNASRNARGGTILFKTAKLK